MLARLIDAVLVLVNNVEADNVEHVDSGVGCLRQFAKDGGDRPRAAVGEAWPLDGGQAHPRRGVRVEEGCVGPGSTGCRRHRQPARHEAKLDVEGQRDTTGSGGGVRAVVGRWGGTGRGGGVLRDKGVARVWLAGCHKGQAGGERREDQRVYGSEEMYRGFGRGVFLWGWQDAAAVSLWEGGGAGEDGYPHSGFDSSDSSRDKEGGGGKGVRVAAGV